MNVKKALITAAGPDQRKLPIQTLIDRDGKRKSVLEILIKEILSANITEICIVVHPKDEEAYSQLLGEFAHYVTFAYQENSYGYGHAIYCAKDFLKNEPFLHLVGDHLYVHKSDIPCAKELVDFANKHECAVSLIQATRESLISNFGVVGGKGYKGLNAVYELNKVIEKPTPTLAEQELIVPGLRAGHYLCFFGMHVLTPKVMEILDEKFTDNPQSNINLSKVLNQLTKSDLYLGLLKEDLRFDMGDKYGLLKAQIALALSGKERDQVLTEILDLLLVKELSNRGK